MLLSALLACYLIWGTTYLAIRIALGSFPPFLQDGHALPGRRRFAHALGVVAGKSIADGP